MIIINQKQAVQELRTLMDEHGLQDWSIGLNNRKHGLGSANRKKKEIQLSRYYIHYGSDATIRDTMRHEIAHALDWKRNGKLSHDWRWKAIAREIGADPTRTTHDEQYIQNVPTKYTLICDNCGAKDGIGRRLKHQYDCGTCYKKTGEKHTLRLVQNY